MNIRTRSIYIALLIIVSGSIVTAYYTSAHVLLRQQLSRSITGTIANNTALYGKCAGPNYHSMQIKTPEYGVIHASFTNEELNIPVSEASSLEGKSIKITLKQSVFSSLKTSPVREYRQLGRTILGENTYLKLEISGKQIAGIPKHLRVKKC